MITINSCFVITPGNYTPDGVKNYIESEKRIRKNKREYRKWHRQHRRKIERLQKQKAIPYK